MRKKIVIQNLYLRKIDRFVDELYITNKEEFKQEFINFMLYELKVLRDCSEKNIINYYINYTKKLIPNENVDFNLQEHIPNLKVQVRKEMVKIYASQPKTSDNLIDIYFNDVKKEYIYHPIQEQDEIEFTEENREIFLKNNLKLVVEVAKRYTNLGLPFEDLIQAGNLGLCIAFERYDKDRANLRKSILKDINNLEEGKISFEQTKEIIDKNFVYTKNLDTTIKTLPQNGFGCKQEFIDWANKNIKTAVFASVAFQWIRATIISEINKSSRVLHIPKSITNDNQSTTIISLDSINVHTNDVYHDNQISEVASDNFIYEDEELERDDKNSILGEVVEKMLYKLSALETRIIKKSFGIGYPYQLTSMEIAENEGLSSNKVKYILKVAMEKINNNLTQEDKEKIKDMLM